MEKPTEENTGQEEKFDVSELMGRKVTSVTFSDEDGCMLEFDGIIRIRTCCPHIAFFKRTVQ